MSEIAKLTAARIAVMTGMRRGEVLALTWEKVDFDNGCVRVSKSYNRKLELKATKTKAGVRTIHVDDETMGCLRRWKACQARTLATLRKTQSKDTPVICNAVGGRLRPDGLWRWWRRFADGNGFAGLKFHELRHTQTSLLLSSGVDVKTVQRRLGHARADVTLDTYAHFVRERDRDAADLIERLLFLPLDDEAGAAS